MKKKIVLLLALITSAHSKIEPYAGLQVGAENLKGNRYDLISLDQDSYTYPKSLKEWGSVVGGHIGVDKIIDHWLVGIEIEANLMSAKHSSRHRPIDTTLPAYKTYQQEFFHVGNVALGFKVGGILVPSITVYAKPLVTVDYFRTKTFYTQGLNIEDTPLHSYRKTRKIVGTGLALGLEKRIHSFKVGTEIRYTKHRSLQRSLQFNPVEAGTLKAKPKTIAATMRISYCF
jgi:hypothetical protein